MTDEKNLTTRQGHPVYDNQHQRTIGDRGPATLENYHFLEKISHFDRERILGGMAKLGLLGISWEFHAPVKLGDTISANVTPLEARPSKTPARGILKIGFEVLNQNDEVVQTGSIVLLMRRRPDPAS